MTARPYRSPRISAVLGCFALPGAVRAQNHDAPLSPGWEATPRLTERQQLAKPASLKIARQRLRRFGIAIGAFAVGAAATVAFAVTPASGGAVGGSALAVDTTAGEQIDPHLSGDLAAYTDQSTGSGVIRYYDFLNPGSSGTVPSGTVWDVDELSDVNGSHIAFARQHADLSRSCMVFDRVTSSTVEIGAGQGTVAGATALGSDTVAFVNFAANDGDIVVGKISAPAAPLVNLSASLRKDTSPAVSPLGEAVVWQSSDGLVHCDVMKSIRSGASWSPAQVVSDTTAEERNPDTDGISVTYDSNRAGALGGGDIFFQPISGGVETQVELDGIQRNPSISGGVIAFESKATGATTWDLFVYQTSTNTVFQVTSTPATNEILSDVTTLGNGDIRVVWAADDDFFLGEHNIYARTFSLPSISIYDFVGFFQPIDNLPTLNIASAGSSIPVKFSLGGDQGLAIFAAGYPASSPIPCDATEPGAIIEETVNAGSSSLSYDPTTDRYCYVWKTDKSWKGTCRMLVVGLNDGSHYFAKFRFK
jgi:hypothetical protein